MDTNQNSNLIDKPNRCMWNVVTPILMYIPIISPFILILLIYRSTDAALNKRFLTILITGILLRLLLLVLVVWLFGKYTFIIYLSVIHICVSLIAICVLKWKQKTQIVEENT